MRACQFQGQETDYVEVVHFGQSAFEFSKLKFVFRTAVPRCGISSPNWRNVEKRCRNTHIDAFFDAFTKPVLK